MGKKSLFVSFIVGVSLFISILLFANCTFYFWMSFYSKWPLISVISGVGQEKEALKRAIHQSNVIGYIYSLGVFVLAIGFGLAAKGVSDLKKWGIQFLTYLMIIVTIIGFYFYYQNYVDFSEMSIIFERDSLISFLFWFFLPLLLTFCFSNSSFRKQFK